jgi:hypothetical protein
MADKHPYTSGQSGLTQTIGQLRKSFPATITADTLKKLGIAPNNESYILNILKFIGVLDAENKKVPQAAAAFTKHNSGEFQAAFGELIQNAYNELFELHGPDAWTLDSDKLISFFRHHDETTDLVGRRQANTFQTLARLAGKLSGDAPSPGVSKVPKPAKKLATAVKKSAVVAPAPEIHKPASPPITMHGSTKDAGVALTVRIEINLPAGGDQATYDAIFKSIRENLMNGNGP